MRGFVPASGSSAWCAREASSRLTSDCGVVEVAEVHAAGRADRDAGRVLALLHAVDAEGALVGVALRVDEARVVGAGGEAGLAADALVVVTSTMLAELVDVAGAGRAAGHARRVVAVVAALGADLHREVSGTCRASRSVIQSRLNPSGTWFSVLQATTQSMQPTQRRVSMTMPKRAIVRPPRSMGDEVDVHAGAAHQRVGRVARDELRVARALARARGVRPFAVWPKPWTM